MVVGLAPAQPSKPEFSVSTSGDASFAVTLGEALDAQWTYGFGPGQSAPEGFDPLTNGFYKYPAALNPCAAVRMLSLLPEGHLLDPFCGSGTALVEAARAGRAATGADASPLALWIAAHHSWRPPQEELETLREVAARVAGGGGANSFTRIRHHLSRSAADGRSAADASASAFDNVPSIESALWFCLIVSEQRAKRQRRLASDPTSAFTSVVNAFAHGVGRLSDAALASSRGGGGAAGDGAVEGVRASVAPTRLILSDARELSLPTRVSCILTSPPYPGVYDYLSMARQERAAHGDVPVAGLATVPEGRSWPAVWSSGREIGARRAMKKQRAGFRAAWEGEQRDWLRAASNCLVSPGGEGEEGGGEGGRAALLIGDGDGIDNLEVTRVAAEASGWRLLASATISSELERTQRRKGTRRTEHALLLETV